MLTKTRNLTRAFLQLKIVLDLETYINRLPKAHWNQMHISIMNAIEKKKPADQLLLELHQSAVANPESMKNTLGDSLTNKLINYGI